MNLKKALIFCFIAGSLYSCKWMAECYPEFTGQVLSTTTKAPVQGATVTLINQNISVQTDENGFFKMSASGCFDAHFKISKANYKPFEITFSSSSNWNSYQVRSDSKSVDYKEPVRSADSSVVTGTWINQNSERFSVSSNSIVYYLDTLKKVSDEITDIQNAYKTADSLLRR
jgi:hypothetical protein